MTTPLTQRVALVTGASSGIGEAIALRFAAMGITTYAAARAWTAWRGCFSMASTCCRWT